MNTWFVIFIALLSITPSLCAAGPTRLPTSNRLVEQKETEIFLPEKPNPTDESASSFKANVKAPQAHVPTDLDSLLDLTSKSLPKSTDNETAMRLELVRSAGFEVGLARGFENKLTAEQMRLERYEDMLNQQFSFRDLFLIANYDHPAEEALHLQPPIISELEDVVQIEDDGRILKTIDGVFRIIDSERFVSQPPRWQEYLMSTPPKFDVGVYEVSLPRNDTEIGVWRVAVSKGWQQGQYQAIQEIEQRILNLGRDFNGMLAYVELKLSGKINNGYVAREQRGVDGGGDEMSVNARTYQITNASGLNPITEKWNALVSSSKQPSYETAGLRVFRHVNKCSKGDSQECP